MAGARRPLESRIEDFFTDSCAARGIYQHKNTGRNGIPDRMMIFRGRVWFLELKRPGERPTELQESVARDMRDHGAVTLWADSRETVEAVLDAIESGGPPPEGRLYGLPKNLRIARMRKE